jgi:hypothetical protein
MGILLNLYIDCAEIRECIHAMASNAHLLTPFFLHIFHVFYFLVNEISSGVATNVKGIVQGWFLYPVIPNSMDKV